MSATGENEDNGRMARQSAGGIAWQRRGCISAANAAHIAYRRHTPPPAETRLHRHIGGSGTVISEMAAQRRANSKNRAWRSQHAP